MENGCSDVGTKKDSSIKALFPGTALWIAAQARHEENRILPKMRSILRKIGENNRTGRIEWWIL
jgi:hypothetical protein